MKLVALFVHFFISLKGSVFYILYFFEQMLYFFLEFLKILFSVGEADDFYFFNLSGFLHEFEVEA